MRRDPTFEPRGGGSTGEPTADMAQAAAAWIARGDRGLTAAEREEFARWQAEDRRHRQELERLQHAWRGLDALEHERAVHAMADEVLARARSRQAVRRLRTLAGVGIAAALIVMGAYFGWQQWDDSAAAKVARLPKENYRVLASTLQRKVLPDGSVAELNGDSRIEVDYSGNARSVRLLNGEAHFIVLKNPERPFYVSAGPVTVRAVGTAFNVRLASAKVEVLVTEGKVKLENTTDRTVLPAGAAGAAVDANPPLVEGQKAVITREATAVSVDQIGRAEMDIELGWQSTRLVFNNTPLDEVVEGFNRYNQHRLTLGDPKLKERALTGVFRADNREGFVRLLRASVDVKAEERTPHETVLLPIR